MEASQGGYRETESGLDASILWSCDKSEKEREQGGGVGERWKSMQGHTREEDEEEEEEEQLVLLEVTDSRTECYRNVNMDWIISNKLSVCCSYMKPFFY